MSVRRGAVPFQRNTVIVRQLSLPKLPSRERRTGRCLDHRAPLGVHSPLRDSRGLSFIARRDAAVLQPLWNRAYLRERRHPDTIDMTTASLDDPDAYPPTTEVWLEDRLSWQPTSPDTKKCDGFS